MEEKLKYFIRIRNFDEFCKLLDSLQEEGTVNEFELMKEIVDIEEFQFLINLNGMDT